MSNSNNNISEELNVPNNTIRIEDLSGEEIDLTNPEKTSVINIADLSGEEIDLTNPKKTPVIRIADLSGEEIDLTNPEKTSVINIADLSGEEIDLTNPEKPATDDYTPTLDALHPDKWWDEEFTTEKKIACLQLVENIEASRQNREPRKVVIADLGGYLGEFKCGTPDTIYISDKYFKKYDENDTTNRKIYCSLAAINTILHEGRHAYQYDCIIGEIIIEAAKRELWRKAFYYKAKDHDASIRHHKYFFDPTEEDANITALSEMEQILGDLYKNDDSLKKYIKKLKDHYEGCVNDATKDLSPDFRNIIIKEIEDNFIKATAETTKNSKINRAHRAIVDFAPSVKEKRKFSVVHMIMTGSSVLWLALMYLIANPNGFINNALWLLAAVIGFLPTIVISWKKGLPKFFRSRIGGIILIAIFLISLIFIQFIYMWLCILYIIVGILYFLKLFCIFTPNFLTIVREEADGSTTVEMRILGDNPDSEISAVERELKNEGYTIQK